MKILHVCKKYPNALGGDAVVVRNLQKQQETAGHKVVIVTSNCREIKNGTHIYKYGLRDTPARLDHITLRRLVSLVMLAFKMFGILWRERPDVIHTHSVDMAFIASFAARAFRTPLIHTFHIVTFYDTRQSQLRRKTEIWLAKHAKPHRTTAPNTYDVTKLRSAGLHQAALLPNGVDMAFWDRKNAVGHGEPFQFVAIGRLEEQKGYSYLIKAAALLSTMSSHQFKVTIVGEGRQHSRLQALIKSLKADHLVTLAGFKTPEETRQILRRANAAIFPSLYETTPLTLLEAWATATPVIATPVGILRGTEADYNAAYIVAPQNEQALMLAMNRMIADAEIRDAMAHNGYEEAKKYAWPEIAKSAEALYRSVV